MIELTNTQNVGILTRTPSSTTKIQLLHLRLEEEVGVEAKYSSSLQSDSSDYVALSVQHQSIFLNELEYPLKKMMRKEMMLALVSPSLQVCLRLFENFLQFSSLELRVSPYLQKCPHFPSGFVYSLSDLSRIC